MVDLELVGLGLLFAAGLLGVALALFLFGTSSNRVHLLLAFVLVVEMGAWALVQAIMQTLDRFDAISAQPENALFWVAGVGWSAAGPLYLLFGIYAIPWRPLRRLQSPLTVAACFAFALALFVLMRWRINAADVTDTGVLLVNLPDFVKAVVGFAIIAFVFAARRFADARARQQGLAFLVAFGVRDAAWIVVSLDTVLFVAAGITVFPHDAWFRIFLHGSFAVFAVALAMAILRGSILDLPRRLHAGISKTALVAIIVAVFVGVQTFISEYFTNSVGLVGGAVAAGMLVLGIAPLEGMTRRLADAAIPSARMPLTSRQALAFYRDQVRIAYSDGAVGAKERKALANIRQRLSIPAQAAIALEDDIAAGMSRRGSPSPRQA